MAQATNATVLLPDDVWISRNETLEQLSARFFEVDGPSDAAEDALSNNADGLQERTARSDAVVATKFGTADNSCLDSDVECLTPFEFPDLERESRKSKTASPPNVGQVTLYQFGRRGLVCSQPYSNQKCIKKVENTPWPPRPFHMEDFSDLSDSEYSGSVEFEMISVHTISVPSFARSWGNPGSSCVVESDPKAQSSMSSGRVKTDAKRPKGNGVFRRALRWFCVG